MHTLLKHEQKQAFLRRLSEPACQMYLLYTPVGRQEETDELEGEHENGEERINYPSC